MAEIPVPEVPKIVKNHQNVSKETTLLMRGFTGVIAPLSLDTKPLFFLS
jgi:hypothetical protein